MSVAALAGVLLIYLAGSKFFAPPAREISFEEFGQYRQATSSAAAAAKSAVYAAPIFTLPDLQGKKIKLNDFAGKIVVLVFWTIWSPAAQDQIAILESYYQKIGDGGGITLIAVNSQENKSAVASFLKRGEYRLPVLMDEYGVAGELYNISILPAFYFIDQRGNVRDKYIGVLSEDEINERTAALRVD